MLLHISEMTHTSNLHGKEKESIFTIKKIVQHEIRNESSANSARQQESDLGLKLTSCRFIQMESCKKGGLVFAETK